LSIVGGVRHPSVTSKNFACPRDGVGHPDASWLRACPEFQVLWPVVIAHAVAVVDRLIWQQVAAEDLLHHQDVLEDVLTFAGARVTGCPGHDITSLVTSAPALPPAV